MRNTQPLLAPASVSTPGGRLDDQAFLPARQSANGAEGVLLRFQKAVERMIAPTALKAPAGGKSTTPFGRVIVRPVGASSQAGDLRRLQMPKASDYRIARWKRALDITLVVATAPLWFLVMLWITVWIKLVSPGPTFYKQERVGHRGRRFMILKFRSMKVNVETRTHESHVEALIQSNAPMQKLDGVGDYRLIRGGRLLRALGLDELPQLFNVLKGEMSLVGPRPCTPNEFARYEAWHHDRVKAAPGLTGLWQVSGKNRTTFTEMIAMDVFYAEHMTLCMDIEIILRTGAAVGRQTLDIMRPRKAATAGRASQTNH